MEHLFTSHKKINNSQLQDFRELDVRLDFMRIMTSHYSMEAAVNCKYFVKMREMLI